VLTHQHLLRGREDIVGLQRVGRAVGTEYLPALALPLRLVDGVDPVLNLHHDATVLLNESTAAWDTLSRLDGLITCGVISDAFSISISILTSLART